MIRSLTDEQLINRYQTGKNPGERDLCINELFKRHQRKVSLWCLRIADNRESAADLAQDVFCKVFQKLDSFEGHSKFSTWLYTVTRNHCLNHLKTISRQPETVQESELFHFEDPESGEPFELVDAADGRRRMMELVCKTLDETELKVMTLHFGEGMPLESVTRVLRLRNKSGAKAYIVSSKRKLDRAIERFRASGG